ncbi:MAG: hypothetical protein CSA15_02895 [Candidatus Delongbacteria bacterium]|nr:MAG: hypothetical protein CSA15_02895 [Candidatus Delongbacteria bacterium]
MNNINKTIFLRSIKLLVGVLVFLTTQNFYGQKNNSFDTKYINNILENEPYSGKVIYIKHFRGKLYLKLSNHLEDEGYKFANIKYIENSVGDFNKNGIEDVCARVDIKGTPYICFIEHKKFTDSQKEAIVVYSYLEKYPYTELKIDTVKNDTLFITTKISGLNSRKVGLAFDKKSILRIVTPNKFNEMKDINIFKSELEGVKREYFISDNAIRTQYERYKKGNLFFTSELSGYNDFSLRFTVQRLKKPKDFKKEDFILEVFEFLESNTRFPTILTKIEHQVLIKNEEGVAISNKLKYDVKNYITPNSYFVVGEIMGKNEFLFDLVYYKE